MPKFLDDPSFPEDTKKRARDILNGCKGGSVGSYTDSTGIEVIRKHVAEYIERRDGHPSDWNNVIISAGASDAIKVCITLFLNKNFKFIVAERFENLKPMRRWETTRRDGPNPTVSTLQRDTC